MRRLAWLRPWAAGMALTAWATTGCAQTPATPATAAADPAPVVSSPIGLIAAGSSSVAGISTASAQLARPAPNAVNNTAPAGSGPNVWAVNIGIQDYQAPTHHTYGGDGDTAVFHQLLQRAGWPDNHILQLVDGDATLGNIRAAMQWLVGRSSPGSFTVFHYSGHVCISSAGGCPSGHTYLWSVDNGFLSEQEFGQTMRGLQGTAWVDVSGCESAAFDQGISSAQRLFTAATGAHEKGYEISRWQESVWTGLLVDQGMLQGRADQNGDGRVSVQEAVRWAQSQAAIMTSNQHPYGPQHPYAVGGTSEWYLTATSPGPQQPRPASPSSGGGAKPPPAGPAKPPSTPPTTDQCAGLSVGLLHC